MSGTGSSGAAGEILDHLSSLALVDHHVHGAFTTSPSPTQLASAFCEADTAPVSEHRVAAVLDSQLGFAVRRWCAPLLDLEPFVSAHDYVARRAALGEAEVNARLLRTAGVGTWLVDTGYASTDVSNPDQLAEASGAQAREVVRLESLAEQVITSGPHDYPQRLRDLVARRRDDAVAWKSVLAYRTGFDIDYEPADDAVVQRAADRWAADLAAAEAGATARLVDPALLGFGLQTAVATGLPLQLHVGFGDRDLDLHRVDPMLLLPFLRQPATARVPVMLLHCYPFERQAGYLAQAFANVYLDVGLAVNAVGARSPSLIARSLELAPFGKVLYSSDAWGPAELHHLGALLWRRGAARVLGGFVDDGDWSLADALRVGEQIAVTNASRVYQL